MPIAFAAFFVLLHQKLIVMSQSNIITGQYVQINQSPASIGERIFGRLIDLLVLFCYVGSMSYLMNRFHPDFMGEWITVFVIILPFALYRVSLFQRLTKHTVKDHASKRFRISMAECRLPSVLSGHVQL